MKAMFKNAYDLYKFENVVMLSINEIYDEKSDEMHEILTMCAYNPFVKHGLLFCRNISDENVENSIADIKEFNQNRFRDLEGYPLRVIGFFYQWKPNFFSIFQF